MPEGDVVALTAQRLDAALAGRPLVRAELRWPGTGGAHLVGATPEDVLAYGKHLLMRLDSGWTLRTHLRMDGSWYVARTGTHEAAGKGAFVRAVLANEQWTATGHRLGMLDLVRTRDEHVILGHLGPDILAADWDPEQIVDRLVGTGAPLAEALLDQRAVAGIGTLYVAEGLFATRTNPWLPVAQLPRTALLRLVTVIRGQMLQAVAGGLGARIVHMHNRAGQRCPRCRSVIVRELARQPPEQRPIFWCPTCQRAG